MMKSLVVVNPHAASGAAVNAWHSIEAQFAQRFGEPLVCISQSIAALPQAIIHAAQQGVQQVISVGGDGTNHAIINALIRYNQQHPAAPLIYGSLPAGTGQDWARGLGMPLNIQQSLAWLAAAQPRPVDVGHIRYDQQERFFLNISSAGISNDVVVRVERADKRKPWTFFGAAVGAILGYQPEYVQIALDGQPWFEGHMYIVAIANGKYFGQGMKAAPDAAIDDGLFDVLIMPAIHRARLLAVLPTLYQGTHIHHPAVRIARAHTVQITTQQGAALGVDLDGEPAAGRHLVYTVQPGALQILS